MSDLRRDVILSIAVHVLIVAATTLSSPFEIRKKIDESEVIKVSLMALPEMKPAEILPGAIPVAKAQEVEQPKVQIADAKSQIKTKTNKPKPVKQHVVKRKIKPDKSAEELAGEEEGVLDATAQGTPFEGARTDNASFTYPYWFTEAYRKILLNWRNSVDADGVLLCVVYFQVIQSGRVVESKVIKSSGIPVFDNLCLIAVDRSSPFPPLPRDFKDEILGITLPFKFEPR